MGRLRARLRISLLHCSTDMTNQLMPEYWCARAQELQSQFPGRHPWTITHGPNVQFFGAHRVRCGSKTDEALGARQSPLPPIETRLRCRSELTRGAPASLDHLVGEREQPIRHVETERLGGLEIDHELELGRLHHRRISRLLALEYSPGIDAG